MIRVLYLQGRYTLFFVAIGNQELRVEIYMIMYFLWVVIQVLIWNLLGTS